MNKIRRVISIVLVFAMVFSMSAMASSDYAYSIGGIDPVSNDDFTPNVYYSSSVFGMMNSITDAYYNCTPNLSYLKGNTPSGNSRLESKIILLTGHANSSEICLDNGNNMIGICKDNDFTGGSGRQYVGLNNFTMTNTDLIMFFGCNTADGNDNLCSSSLDRGASVAVGTTKSVVSREGEGAIWVQKFIDGLYNGLSVFESGIYANNFVSITNSMRSGWTFLGDGNTIVNPSNTWNLVSNENVVELDSNIISTPLQIDCKDIDSVNTRSSAGIQNVYIEIMVDYLLTIDSDFDLDKYAVTINEFSNDLAIITFGYFIGDDIATEKGFTFVLDDNIITSVTYNETLFDDTNTNIDENAMIELVSTHKDSRLTTPIADDTIQTYVYNFSTGELKYIEESYILCDEMIIENYNEVVLN